MLHLGPNLLAYVADRLIRAKKNKDVPLYNKLLAKAVKELNDKQPKKSSKTPKKCEISQNFHILSANCIESRNYIFLDFDRF